MALPKPNKTLTDDQLLELLHTPYADRQRKFPGRSVKFLRLEARRAKQLYPNVVVDFHKRIAHKPLSTEQLKVLLHTPAADRSKVFPGYPVKFLRAENARAQAEVPVEARIKIDSERATAKAREQSLRNEISALRTEGARLKGELELLSAWPAANKRPFSIKARKKSNDEGVTCAVASDWHCEEKVTREQVNGLNEFNLDIFEQRALRFFTGAIKLNEMMRARSTIDRMILALLGDFISGNIHEDLIEGCQLGPMDAAALAQDTIAGGIDMLLQKTDLKLTIPICVGNHERVVKKSRSSLTSHANSIMWLIGHSLQREFKSEPRVEFIRERAYLTYLKVFDWTLRFHHGDKIRYKGGIGGMTIPVVKKIAKWDIARRADLDVFGHFHQFFPTNKFVVNGSLIGFNPHAIDEGYDFQPPQQAFFLIEKRAPITHRAPIWLEG